MEKLRQKKIFYILHVNFLNQNFEKIIEKKKKSLKRIEK